VGEPASVSGAAGVPERVADAVAALTVIRLTAAAKQKAEADLAAQALIAAAAPPPPAPPPVEDEVDPELTAPVAARAAWQPDANRVRAAVTVGAGAVLRGLELSGEGAATLAELRNGPVPGLGVYVQLKPLELFDGTAGKRWSDLELELHYRRAFVRATGVGGDLEGQSCTMSDDDVQARLTWRWRLGEHPLATSLGVAGGFSHEATLFACALPVVSTTWRGVDAQLRVRQPLWREVLALELSVGPRFLLGGPDAPRPGFSFGGEAWLELKPASVFFARAGVRASRLAAATDALAVVDTRVFLALEVGAFF
jgi:hypothetical protein